MNQSEKEGWYERGGKNGKSSRKLSSGRGKVDTNSPLRATGIQFTGLKVESAVTKLVRDSCSEPKLPFGRSANRFHNCKVRLYTWFFS